MNQLKLGKFLASLRTEKGLTQEQLAELLDVSSSKTISKWECGNATPDFEMMIKISEVLNVSLYELSICKRIESKRIKKEDILKAVTLKDLKRVSRKKKLFSIIKILTIIICFFSVLYTFTNYNQTKVYTLESLNSDFRIIGTFSKNRDFNVLALTKIAYIGTDYKILNTSVYNYQYELSCDEYRIFNKDDKSIYLEDNQANENNKILKLEEHIKATNFLITKDIKSLNSNSDCHINIIFHIENDIENILEINFKFVERYKNTNIF